MIVLFLLVLMYSSLSTALINVLKDYNLSIYLYL